MVDRGLISKAPGTRLPRFRLGTLLVVVAILGLLFGAMRAIPWAMWRYHVDQAVEAACSAGPDFAWSLNATQAPRREVFFYFLSDRERVLDALFRSVELDPNDIRRIHALRTMRALLRQPCPLVLRKRRLDQALDLATRARLSPMLEKELADAIAEWTPRAGLDAAQRRAILAKAKSASGALFPAWAHILAEIGGREEIHFLVTLGNVHDRDLLDAIHNSAMSGCRWPGLLPALKSWLDDPTIAPWVLRYSLLSSSPEGRNLLIAYAANAANPVESRRSAIERLLKTIPGTKLLINAAKTPRVSAILAASAEGDLQTTFQAALTKHDEWNGRFLWLELIDGLDWGSSGRLSASATPIDKAASEAENRLRQFVRESNLHCLHWITGRHDLRSSAQWRQWYETSSPPPMSQSDLVKLVLEHPEALENSGAILRRIVPYQFGGLPAECIPLYERMAREGPPAARYWASVALLFGTSKTDVVPIAIDLISQRSPGDVNAGNWAPIDLLKQRFAENLYWDSAAWREWWAQHDPGH